MNGEKPDLSVDWNQVFSYTPSTDHAAFTKLLIDNSHTPRVPKVSKFASEELLKELSSAELDTDPCPGCGDRFLLPSSYFQHIYRSSRTNKVDIFKLNIFFLDFSASFFVGLVAFSFD